MNRVVAKRAPKKYCVFHQELQAVLGLDIRLMPLISTFERCPLVVARLSP
jgi:hypothetical protein